ncbi:MAG: hypothetical protein AAGF12_36810 [Myxococcota bacterium]
MTQASAMKRVAVAVGLLAASLPYFVLHWLGAGDAAGVLSGTVPSSEALLWGLAYVASWFLFILAAPVLGLALGLELAASRVWRVPPEREPSEAGWR